MEKEKTELLKLLEHQCFWDYVEDEETNGLREIAEYHLPDFLVKNGKIFMSLIHAFLYGAMMGIRHERKRRRNTNRNNYKNKINAIINKIQREDVLEYLYVFIKGKIENVIKGDVINE